MKRIARVKYSIIEFVKELLLILAVIIVWDGLWLPARPEGHSDGLLSLLLKG